jgi:hypothetical protein
MDEAMDHLTEVGAVVVLADILDSISRFQKLDLVRTKNFIIKNEKSIVKKGICPFDISDNWVGHPFWLYPDATFLSKTEKVQIERASLYQTKLDVLSLLESVEQKNWLVSFLDYIQNNKDFKSKWPFYSMADRAYAVQSLIEGKDQIKVRATKVVKLSKTRRHVMPDFGDATQPPLNLDNNMPGCSGGLTDIIELIYPFYEFHHFYGIKKLKNFFGGYLPIDRNIHELEELYQDHNENDEMHGHLAEYRLNREFFRSEFVTSVNKALGVQDNERKTGFRFYHQMLHDFKREPFSPSPHYSNIVYAGEHFKLTTDQAKIIEILHKNYEKNKNEFLSSKEIACLLNPDDENPDLFRLEDKFRDKSAQTKKESRVYKPVYHRLIQKSGDKKLNLYRFRLPKDIDPIKSAN